MTLTTLEKGYLEGEYLEGPYLTSLAEGSAGMQTEFIIVDALKLVAAQTLLSIVDFLNNSGMQTEFVIKDEPNNQGFQAEFTIISQSEIGMQSLFQIVDKAKNAGMQTELNIASLPDNQGMQATLVISSSKSLGFQTQFSIQDSLRSGGMQTEFIAMAEKASGSELRADKYPTLICGSYYLEGGYLEEPYLTEINCLVPGMQSLFKIENKLNPIGMQTEFTIVDKLVPQGMQTEFTIVDALKQIGMQFDSVISKATASQFFATIYNTTNLRILCEFPSRGLTNSNWTANTTATGDFSVQNLDTDIIEQVWKSAPGNVTGVRIQTDTGLPQGVFMDTMAILNHNMTRSANLILLGSNDPTFVSIGITIPIESRTQNIYYISPTLPIAGYRYWRLDIDDSTNTDGYIEIGTLVFGSSQIFQGECFVDELDFQFKDFADSVRTEGFTNVSNSRALKRSVRLEFRFLNFQRNNFRILRNLFETYRTTQKCLWIPTPSATSYDVTSRFAAFAKLSTIPSERHRYLGGDADYVSFTIEIDESL